MEVSRARPLWYSCAARRRVRRRWLEPSSNLIAPCLTANPEQSVSDVLSRDRQGSVAHPRTPRIAPRGIRRDAVRDQWPADAVKPTGRVRAPAAAWSTRTSPRQTRATRGRSFLKSEAVRPRGGERDGFRDRSSGHKDAASRTGVFHLSRRRHPSVARSTQFAVIVASSAVPPCSSSESVTKLT
jgi:hypothetical protein